MELLSQSIKMSDFFIWWRQGLMAWLPASIQQKSQQNAIIHCVVENKLVTLCVVDKSGREQDTLQLDLSLDTSGKDAVEQWQKRYPNHEVVLQVSHEQCLLKSVSLPIGATDKLNEIMSFEIDRQTPFTLDKVYLGYRINKNSEAKTQSLSVTMAVVPKQLVSKITEQLAVLSLEIALLSIADNDGNIIRIPVTESATLKKSFTWLQYSLALLAFSLFLLFLYQPVMDYEKGVEVLEAPLATAKQQAQSVAKLNQENTLMFEHGQFLKDKTDKYRSRLVIMAELAEILPKHTWLERSDIQDTKLTIRGSSDSASDLIALLTQSDSFSEVRFSAPTTHNNQTNKDRFTIQALIVPVEISDAD